MASAPLSQQRWFHEQSRREYERRVVAVTTGGACPQQSQRANLQPAGIGGRL
ncbi:MAG: hypothetical protein VKJ46_00825 [Leptolyngbyaceae bacterium]|nr:hypothetical protein [Leptolyngbyaceae bacterium]